MSATSELLSALAKSLMDITPVVCIGVVLACAFLLWGSLDWLKPLAVIDVREQHRPWFGLGLIVASSFLIAHAAAGIGRAARAAIACLWERRKARAAAAQETEQRQVAKANQRRVLQQLTPEERGYLKPYIEDQVTTQRFLTDDGVAGGRAPGCQDTPMKWARAQMNPLAPNLVVALRLLEVPRARRR